MAEAQAFQKRCQETALRFLQTVVVIDDQAILGADTAPAPVSGLVAPSDRAAVAAPAPPAPNPQPPLSSHSLNAKLIADSMADKGITCAVLKPASGEDAVRERIARVTRRADIIVVDWKLGDEGALALDILYAAAGGDEPFRDRYRLLVIYTAEADVDDILGRVHGRLKAHWPALTSKDGALQQAPLTVTLYMKPGTSPRGEFQHRVVGPAELCNRLVADFAAMTGGLLANVAIDAIAAVRENAHRILARFPRELDGAYLSHRAHCAPPDEAEGHVMPLVAAEIEDAIGESVAGIHLSPETIGEWFDAFAGSPPSSHPLATAKAGGTWDTISMSVIRLLREGLGKGGEGWRQLCRDAGWPEPDAEARHMDGVSDLLSQGGVTGEGRKGDEGLAVLMSVRSRYSGRAPQLELGTILARGETGGGKAKYLLCVQPACDCLRVPSGGWPFHFLRLQRCDDDDQPFAILLRDIRGDVRLAVSMKPDAQCAISFRPKCGNHPVEGDRKPCSQVSSSAAGTPSAAAQPPGTVAAAVSGPQEGHEWVFSGRENAADNTVYRWVCALRPMLAQSIAVQFAARLSRVGVVESEWLRRRAGRQPPE